MSVTIRVRPNGPLLVEGPVTIVDQNGNAFPLNPDKPAVALCRCGQSARKPFDQRCQSLFASINGNDNRTIHTAAILPSALTPAVNNDLTVDPHR